MDIVIDQKSPVNPVSESRDGNLSVRQQKRSSRTTILLFNIVFKVHQSSRV